MKKKFFSAFTDRREERDLPLSLHHVAWFWCPRVSGILPKLPLQSAGIGSVGGGSRAGCGALQCWNRTLGDVFISWHLCGPGKSCIYVKYMSSWFSVSTNCFLVATIPLNFLFLFLQDHKWSENWHYSEILVESSAFNPKTPALSYSLSQTGDV